MKYASFVQELLKASEAGSRQAGATDVAQRLFSLRTKKNDERALKGRFALGADSNLYLRTNVFPLHATRLDDATAMTHPALEVEHANRAGIFKALIEGIDVEHKRRESELGRALIDSGEQFIASVHQCPAAGVHVGS